MKYIAILFFTLACWGCQDFFYQAVDHDKLLELKPKIVVNSVLTPTLDSIVIQVAWMESSFAPIDWTNLFEPIPEAIVVLSSGSSKITVPYSENAKKFILPIALMPIVPGHSYQVEATAGGQTVKGTCTIPVANQSLSGVIERKATLNNPNSFDFRAKLTWSDQVGGSNYYSISGRLTALTGGIYGNEYMSNCGLFGNSKRGDLQHTEHLDFSYIYVSATEEVQATVYFYTLDPHLYKYRKALCAYDSGNPFGESTLIYSNIEGGLGIFGGYVGGEVVIK